MDRFGTYDSPIASLIRLASIDAARTGTRASTVRAASVKLALAITVCCAVVKRASAVTVRGAERRSSLRRLVGQADLEPCRSCRR